ncbi:unnamed protein product [Arabis nemorensis]|uniref:Uncharacterized protein n=1 Tax=Arabis nemorensis TaxID=586526 RepID=A0A565C7H9_9BRAS|nr:unnamed protein product [Arabis nemorensis]
MEDNCGSRDEEDRRSYGWTGRGSTVLRRYVREFHRSYTLTNKWASSTKGPFGQRERDVGCNNLTKRS